MDMQVIPFFSANLMQLASKFRRHRCRLILKVVRLPHSPPPPLSSPLLLPFPSLRSGKRNESLQKRRFPARNAACVLRLLSAPPPRSSLSAAAASTPYLSHGELTSFVTSPGRSVGCGGCGPSAGEEARERGGQLLEGRPAMQNRASCVSPRGAISVFHRA